VKKEISSRKRYTSKISPNGNICITFDSKNSNIFNVFFIENNEIHCRELKHIQTIDWIKIAELMYQKIENYKFLSFDIDDTFIYFIFSINKNTELYIGRILYKNAEMLYIDDSKYPDFYSLEIITGWKKDFIKLESFNNYDIDISIVDDKDTTSYNVIFIHKKHKEKSSIRGFTIKKPEMKQFKELIMKEQKQRLMN